MPTPYRDEQRIADRAVQMLQTALKREVHSFKDHYRTGTKTDKGPNRKPLRELQVEADTRIGKIAGSPTGETKTYFNALLLRMGKHGFILNRGADTLRRGNDKIVRRRPHLTEFEREFHRFSLPKHDFIDRALRSSRVAEYIAYHIGEIRGYQVLEALIKKMQKNLDKNTSH